MRVVCSRTKTVCVKWEAWGYNTEYKSSFILIFCHYQKLILADRTLNNRTHAHLSLWESSHSTLFSRPKKYSASPQIHSENARVESVPNWTQSVVLKKDFQPLLYACGYWSCFWVILNLFLFPLFPWETTIYYMLFHLANILTRNEHRIIKC